MGWATGVEGGGGGVSDHDDLINVTASQHHSEIHNSLKQTFKGVRLKKLGGLQNISNATFEPITYNAEDFDTDAFHDVAVNTSRITIPAGLGGYYMFWASANVYNGLAGRRICDLFKNGTVRQMRGETSTSNTPELYCSSSFACVVSAVAGDYFETHMYADGGTGCTVDGTNSITLFGATLLGV